MNANGRLRGGGNLKNSTGATPGCRCIYPRPVANRSILRWISRARKSAPLVSQTHNSTVEKNIVRALTAKSPYPAIVNFINGQISVLSLSGIGVPGGKQRTTYNTVDRVRLPDYLYRSREKPVEKRGYEMRPGTEDTMGLRNCFLTLYTYIVIFILRKNSSTILE